MNISIFIMQKLLDKYGLLSPIASRVGIDNEQDISMIEEYFDVKSDGDAFIYNTDDGGYPIPCIVLRSKYTYVVIWPSTRLVNKHPCINVEVVSIESLTTGIGSVREFIHNHIQQFVPDETKSIMSKITDRYAHLLW